MPKPPRRKPADSPAPAEFSFRWGIPVLDRMPYTMIYNFLLNHYARLGITAQEMMFIIHLAQFRHERADSTARPSLRTIAELMGYKDEQQPRNLKKSLIAKGLLTITPQVGDTDIYDVAPFAARAFALWEAEQAATQAPAPIPDHTPIPDYRGIPDADTPLYPSIGVGIYPVIGEEESVKDNQKNGSKDNTKRTEIPPALTITFTSMGRQYGLREDRLPWARLTTLVTDRGAAAVQSALLTATGATWAAYWAAVEAGK